MENLGTRLSKVASDYDGIEQLFRQLYWKFHKKYLKKKNQFMEAINELWKSNGIAKVSENRAVGLERPEYFVLPESVEIPRYREVKIDTADKVI